MSEKSERIDVLGIVRFGLFLIVVGVIFATTPNLLDKIFIFFRDFELRGLGPLFIPAPRSDHPIVYTAIFHYCLAFAILQVPILAAKFFFKESAYKKAETVPDLLSWLGAAWVTSLLIAKDIDWFAFLGYLIVVIGISIVVKGALFLVLQPPRKG